MAKRVPKLPKIDPCPICANIAHLRRQVLQTRVDTPKHLALNAQLAQAEASHPSCPFCKILIGATHLEIELIETEIDPMCEHCKRNLERQGIEAFRKRMLAR